VGGKSLLSWSMAAQHWPIDIGDFCGAPPRGGVEPVEAVVRLSVLGASYFSDGLQCLQFQVTNFSDGLQLQVKRQKEPTWQQTIGEFAANLSFQSCKPSAARYIRLYHDILNDSRGHHSAINDHRKRRVGALHFFGFYREGELIGKS